MCIFNVSYYMRYYHALVSVSTMSGQVDEINGTFYRSVLNFASQLNDDRRLGGCCAPSDTDSITVLYVNQQNQFVNEVVPGVSVKACECV